MSPPDPPASIVHPGNPIGPVIDPILVRDPPGPDAHYPIALLPVRLETRFAGSLLKVRIFPDEIFADTHEPGLTPDEQAAGAAYVMAIHAGLDAEKAAWHALVARFTAPRAAWIARASVQGGAGARAESWTRAAQTTTLPDSWLVRAYRGTSVFTKIIAAVRQPLALTFAPNPGTQVAVSDALTVDTDLQWTIDFDAAVTAGMATTIDLTKPDAPTPTLAFDLNLPIDLLLVVGLKRSLAPADGAAQLHALLDAHHYTRGLAFVAPGTPTSNSGDAPVGGPADDPGSARSFAVERQAPLVKPGDGSDGSLFALALGLPASTGELVGAVEHVDGAATAGDGHASAMNDALWPATLGYFMTQMMAPRFDDATIARARAFFDANLRAGGPLPAFRIGKVPYGVLPVVSLTHYAPDDPLPHALRVLRDSHFVPAIARVPRVAPGSADPDGDLLKALAVDASSRQVRMRAILGQDVTANTAGWLGTLAAQHLSLLHQARAAAASSLLGSIGIGADTRMGHVDPGTAANLINAPMVTGEPLSETATVSYISWLHDHANPAGIDAIRHDQLPGTARPLLYRVLRHALLVELDRVAVPQLVAANVIAATDHFEVELVQMSTTPALTSYDRITRASALPIFWPQLAPFLARLQILATLATAELDRRFTETLDACSHRLDAWITALATARLWTMRGAAKTGCHLGGFGWVENLRPAAAAAPVGGYIHAPSPAHASTAAVLRNGYLSRGGGGSPYAVDLSSARVRDALQLLDGTRQGEPLAALLGYRFERELHERNLEPQIAPLRKQFPLVAGKTPEGAGPVELVAAGSVIDGLALRAARPASPAGLTTDQSNSFQTALKLLDDAVDGLADLLMAESVFQAVRGSPMAAVASLDSMAQGTAPPDPDVVRSPLGGAAFTQRLAVALDGTTVAPADATPRGAIEPYLDRWIGTLLGDFTRFGCHVVASDGSVKSVTLDQLKLRPLDVVALARTATSGDGELDRRVLDRAGGGATVQYDATSAAHSFAELLELARAAAALLGGARALTPADLVAPPEAAPITDAAAQLAAGRARDALGRLTTAAAALTTALAPVAAALAATTAPSAAQLTSLRAALQAAALFGVAGAYPAAGATATDLVALAGTVGSELTARQHAAPPLTVTDAAGLLAAATATVQAVFGRDFVFLPQLTPPSSLAGALAAAPALLGDTPHLPRQVVQQMARVRAGLGRWRSLFLYAAALDLAPPSLEVAQLPTGQATWAARPGASPANGTLSLLLHRPTQTAQTQGWAGLVIDEWNELIPSAIQQTSIAFRHETPVAEAPQAVLLAVPPSSATTSWTLETLVDTVRESLTLAKLRLVDTVDDLRPFLPAICLTGNTANEAISTDFTASLIAEPAILRST
jgi:hypothetical protein